MNYLLHCALFILFLAHPTHSMELTKTTAQPTPGFIFVTDEQPPQKFRIPLHLAMQCTSVKDMLEDFPESTVEFEWAIQNACAKDVSILISYLDKIDQIREAKQEESITKTLNHLLTVFIQTLKTDALINLTRITDTLDITSTNNHTHITEQLVNKILTSTPSERERFFCLDNLVLFRFVKERLNKRINLDATFIQPYINTLTEEASLPRTESIQSFAKKMDLAPYYVNNQTKTQIMGTINDNQFITKTTHLHIIKNKSRFDLTVELNDIGKINHIGANKDESLFIVNCTRHRGKSIPLVIRSNINNPAIILYNDLYDIYAFTNSNHHELYVAKGYTFGILDTQSNSFTKIALNNAFPITTISTNSDGTMIAVNTAAEIFIGSKENGHLSFQRLDIAAIKRIVENGWEIITNICIHPRENKLYFEVNKNHDPSSNLFYIIDFANNAIKHSHPLLPGMYRYAHDIAFITDDILFLGHPKEDDYFVNIKTGNFWKKERACLSKVRTTLTADCMHSIEEKHRSFLSEEKVKSTQLINQAIIKTIDLFNTGNFPLLLLNLPNTASTSIVLPSDQYTSYDNMPQELKDVIDASYTITGNSLLSRLMSAARNIYQPTAFYIERGIIILAILAAVLFLNKCDEITKKIEQRCIAKVADTILWLIHQIVLT